MPLAHVVCTRDLDEDALAEITRFKLGLEKMCAAKVCHDSVVWQLWLELPEAAGLGVC